MPFARCPDCDREHRVPWLHASGRLICDCGVRFTPGFWRSVAHSLARPFRRPPALPKPGRYVE